MKRIYENVIRNHFKHYSQMLFLAGPRQVGKTTISLTAESLTDKFTYINWDNLDHRTIILAGPSAIADYTQLHTAIKNKPIIVFDEIHKFRHWKNLLKGFFDTYKEDTRIIVTGSSKLDIYRAGGDSLMGRYFPYRIHPFTVAECVRTLIGKSEISAPIEIKDVDFKNLLRFGGFPEPFLKHSINFSNRWKQLRREQLFRQDIRDLSRIQEVDQLELLSEVLKNQTGCLVNYSNLSNKIKVSVDSIRRWITTLSSFYFCFCIRPWSKNITRSLIKEPKIYLWNWGDIDDLGQRSENFIAAHLLKAVHFWTDQGLGNYDLFFLRDKEKREVDFVVTKDNKPWFLVEAKNGHHGKISPNLIEFQKQTQAKHAFQVVIDMEFIDVNCFSYHKPTIVPAKTFLSQLV